MIDHHSNPCGQPGNVSSELGFGLSKLLPVLTLIGLAFCCSPTFASRPNVLFIAIDDLRADLDGLGQPALRTPQLDRFAETARKFSHHYVQVPTCGASRCALIRGRYPEFKAYLSNQSIRNTHSQWIDTCLPQIFRRGGYRTLALGKVTHYPGGMAGMDWAEPPEELPGVWERCWIPASPWKTAQAMMHGYANGLGRQSGLSPHFEAHTGPNSAYPDAWIADEAVRTLQSLSESDQPWLFCVGFFKPHLPFAAPAPWHELHDGNITDLPVAVSAKPTWNSGWHPSGEFMKNYLHLDGVDPNQDIEYARRTRQAYAAAASYMDAQVGRVFQALDELGLDDNTIVVVWSDHGFLLGEHAVWGKHCLYEHALRSPLIIRCPDMPQPGKPCPSVVETVDVFPTLLDYCGLETPVKMDGCSLRPQLDDPKAASIKPARGFWNGDRYTVRNSRWRLTSIPEPESQPQEIHYELFDYANDPWETQNVADRHPEVVAELLPYLPKPLSTNHDRVTRDAPR